MTEISSQWVQFHAFLLTDDMIFISESRRISKDILKKGLAYLLLCT